MEKFPTQLGAFAMVAGRCVEGHLYGPFGVHVCILAIRRRLSRRVIKRSPPLRLGMRTKAKSPFLRISFAVGSALCTTIYPLHAALV
uniref:Uncharacterized protein n=1 Tax=Parascaris univalens TaxID=6257 RepID=A0A915A2R5_PARUN